MRTMSAEEAESSFFTSLNCCCSEMTPMTGIGTEASSEAARVWFDVFSVMLECCSLSCNSLFTVCSSVRMGLETDFLATDGISIVRLMALVMPSFAGDDDGAGEDDADDVAGGVPLFIPAVPAVSGGLAIGRVAPIMNG